MKTIAIYLPQFHEVEENNRWWGKGFTDWVTVRKAIPLYDGHKQPRVPLNKNYYDLSEYNTIKWQAELAKKYEISGFCFYHYWFKAGKKILEKPAENLLKWTDIDMPFCFSWANQTWARTWTNIQNSNAWVGADQEINNHGDGILLKQSYGGKKEWKEHFEYLLPFFKDKRYIQYDEKPVFLIYKPEYMYCLDNMMEYWKELAVQNGLNGICVITVRNNCNKWSQVDYWLMQEFDYSFMKEQIVYNNGVSTIKYEDAWEDVLSRAYTESDDKAFFGGFIDVDDTPRRGEKGFSLIGSSPELFEQYYRKLVEFAAARKREFVFVNAWNEWGEGAYMEPDEENGYHYLEAVKNVMEYIKDRKCDQIKLNINYTDQKTKSSDTLDAIKRAYEKKQKYYQLLNSWLTNNEHHKKIEHVLNALEIKNIAVYGMGDFGKHLVEECKNSSIKILLTFDQKSEFLQMEDPSKYINENYCNIDAVVVTPVMEYKEIRVYLKKIFDVPIISLEELIAECEML